MPRVIAAAALATAVAGCGGGGSASSQAPAAANASPAPAPAGSGAAFNAALVGGSSGTTAPGAGKIVRTHGQRISRAMVGLTSTTNAVVSAPSSVQVEAPGSETQPQKRASTGGSKTNHAASTDSAKTRQPGGGASSTTTTTAAKPATQPAKSPARGTTVAPTQPASSPQRTRTITVTRTRFRTKVRTVVRTVTKTVPPKVPPGAFMPSKHPVLAQRSFTIQGANIGCALGAGGVSCGIQHRVWAAPAQPRSCTGSWGNTLILKNRAAARFTCGGNNPLSESATVLPYGWDDTVGHITCQVRRFGVNCFSTTSHSGFLLSRTGYTLY